ncbi:MAG: hypothetical protein K2N35_15685 [Muribaculaceae bacterium]|nr:hypothetical protein [Muribaculaceae bacterium]
MDNYKVRIADETLADKLDAMGTVLIEEPMRIVVPKTECWWSPSEV